MFWREYDPDEDEDEMEGPPEFIRDMLEQKFHIMDKNKLIIHGQAR
jgi:hypothetical protein